MPEECWNPSMQEPLIESVFSHDDAVAARRERDAAVATVALREQRLAELEAAARAVTFFDWSENDLDAVRAVDALRKLIDR